ncbi:hypothetical protein CHARACLAT_017353 [Characodon lateralis]|uniref:Uncharacterized protein n=1 Tax=Characodon lateralis TaxID=208331 RepID=A0ABU7CP06_9TELE|nr:hypothetical protein [Characodon lateralis]
MTGSPAGCVCLNEGDAHTTALQGERPRRRETPTLQPCKQSIPVKGKYPPCWESIPQEGDTNPADLQRDEILLIKVQSAMTNSTKIGPFIIYTVSHTFKFNTSNYISFKMTCFTFRHVLI